MELIHLGTIPLECEAYFLNSFSHVIEFSKLKADRAETIRVRIWVFKLLRVDHNHSNGSKLGLHINCLFVNLQRISQINT